jgi:hypothetical protein
LRRAYVDLIAMMQPIVNLGRMNRLLLY